eukprot:11207145-Alexandrium_andersonii.AAC.1
MQGTSRHHTFRYAAVCQKSAGSLVSASCPRIPSRKIPNRRTPTRARPSRGPRRRTPKAREPE